MRPPRYSGQAALSQSIRIKGGRINESLYCRRYIAARKSRNCTARMSSSHARMESDSFVLSIGQWQIVKTYLQAYQHNGIASITQWSLSSYNSLDRQTDTHRHTEIHYHCCACRQTHTNTQKCTVPLLCMHAPRHNYTWRIRSSACMQHHYITKLYTYHIKKSSTVVFHISFKNMRVRFFNRNVFMLVHSDAVPIFTRLFVLKVTSTLSFCTCITNKNYNDSNYTGADLAGSRAGCSSTPLAWKIYACMSVSHALIGRLKSLSCMQTSSWY